MNVKIELPGNEILRQSRGPSLRAHIARERSVLAQVAAGQPLAEVLIDLLREIEAEAGNAMMASILEVTDDGQRLRHLAAPSLPAAYREAIEGAPIGEGAGSCGTVVHRGAPVYVSDIATDPLWTDYRDVALKNGLHACWSTPIQSVSGALLGTFAVYYDEPRSPRPSDLEAIAAISLTVALSIERHRADRQLRDMREALDALTPGSQKGS